MGEALAIMIVYTPNKVEIISRILEKKWHKGHKGKLPMGAEMLHVIQSQRCPQFVIKQIHLYSQS